LRTSKFCILYGLAAFLLLSLSKVSALDDVPAWGNASVAIKFEEDPKMFPDVWLKPPMSARSVALDAVGDSDEIVRVQNFLHEELAKYPQDMLKANLHDIYVVRELAYENTNVGGFTWAESKRIYLQSEGSGRVSMGGHWRSGFHHEFAHLLAANHSSLLSMSQWQKLNPPTFQYGNGGLESIRLGTAGTELPDITSWKQGFARLYGMSGPREDFACLCESVFSGDPQFWQAVDQYDVLGKKVRMIMAFYHSLNKRLTEPYFRHLQPYTDPDALPNYNIGDVILFPAGGTVYLSGTPARRVSIPPGGSYIYSDPLVVIVINPPGK